MGTVREISGFYIQTDGTIWSVCGFEKGGRFFAIAQTEALNTVTTVTCEALDEATAVNRLRVQLGASFMNCAVSSGVRYASERTN